MRLIYIGISLIPLIDSISSANFLFAAGIKKNVLDLISRSFFADSIKWHQLQNFAFSASRQDAIKSFE